VHAYVKVSDGCDRRCAYCAVPLIKGDYETVPPAAILADAAAALAAGARELVLVGQDTSRWSWPEWGGLERLLAELKALGPAWLRLLYLQPDGVDDCLLEALAAHAVPYADLPLQHAAEGVLRRMGRTGDGDTYLALLDRVRRALPGVAVRSTFIAGFPGETEADVDTLLAFVAGAQLAVAGVFVFDAQEGTRAAAMPGQVPMQLRLERAARVGEAIDEAAAGHWSGFIGRELDVLVERGSGRPDGEVVGRLAVQAPDIDGRTLLSGRPVRRGQLVSARVVGTLGYDVMATTGD
jgi:ribosomal protein S12 methylthiotransferase